MALSSETLKSLGDFRVADDVYSLSESAFAGLRASDLEAELSSMMASSMSVQGKSECF